MIFTVSGPWCPSCGELVLNVQLESANVLVRLVPLVFGHVAEHLNHIRDVHAVEVRDEYEDGGHSGELVLRWVVLERVNDIVGGTWAECGADVGDEVPVHAHCVNSTEPSQ
jgi:hypothetical protein